MVIESEQATLSPIEATVEGIVFSPELEELMAQVEREGVLRDKKLWLVPTWRCNRAGSPCEICFAYNRLQDAQEKGYLDAGNDYLEKIEALSRLGWGEVIITGGEPTARPSLLTQVLGRVHPDRRIRIISNGDFVLGDESRQQIVEVIKASGKQVQVDISGHDSYSLLWRKVRSLKDSGIPVGIQMRSQEMGIEDDRDFRDFQRWLWENDIPKEVHRVLRMGVAVGRGEGGRHLRKYAGWQVSSIILKLSRLIAYSSDKNQGVYLYPSFGGTKVTANHETPYLLGETPADIGRKTDSWELALRKTCEFYLNLSRGVFGGPTAEEAALYAAAAINTGVPLVVDRNTREKIVSFCWEEFARNFGKTVAELRYFLARNLAARIMASISYLSISENRFSIDLEAFKIISQDVPKTVAALFYILIGPMFLDKNGNEKSFASFNLAGLDDFGTLLSVLDISRNDLLWIMAEIEGNDFSEEEPFAHLRSHSCWCEYRYLLEESKKIVDTIQKCL